MARYNKIRKMDISNGPYTRVSIFMQGCTFNCPNCFNPETHDFDGGKEFTEETIQTVIKLASQDWIKGLSVLGGEPLHPRNIEATYQLVKAFKKAYPDKTVWIWTGFKYENVKNHYLFQYVDVLVDGQFEEINHHPLLKWKGSSNQRVIDIQETRKQKEIVLAA